jgi:alkylation response protein AidB-like acyl-CoA dehydrogenase
MDFAWNIEQQELRASVTEFARRKLSGGSGGGDRDFCRDSWTDCAEFGILGLTVPREYGGSDLDVLTAAGAMEALGYACEDHGFLFSLHAHLWAVVTPLLAFGTPDQKDRLLPGLCDGSLIGAHAMSEPGSGTDAYSLETRAVPEGDSYILEGTKTFVTNAPFADLFVVFATTGRQKGMWGITAFLIERGTPGLSVSAPFRKLGLTSSPMAEVMLEACRVPAVNRLGSEGQGAAVFNHSMGWERSCILASQVGRMQRQLESCVEYATLRRQFGRPIGDFQLVAGKIADMKVRLETARLLLYRAAWQLAAGEPAELEAAVAKLYISEAAVQSALDAVQIRGGYGYMEEYSAAEELRDAVGGTLYSGTSEIQRLIIARQLGLNPT